MEKLGIWAIVLAIAFLAGSIFTGTTAFADDDDDDDRDKDDRDRDDRDKDDRDRDDRKKDKTLESECAEKLRKKNLNLDGLFCQAIIAIQVMLDMVKEIVEGHETRISALEEGQGKQIMRIDGGGAREIDAGEVFFLDGQRTSGNTATDFELASKIVGIDGTITEVQYKIGKSNVATSVTAKLYKNNVEIGSCIILEISTTTHSSCTMTLSEPVVKEDLLGMTDKNSANTRIEVEGKSAFIAIISS